jgi:hypothetical protein
MIFKNHQKYRPKKFMKKDKDARKVARWWIVNICDCRRAPVPPLKRREKR